MKIATALAVAVLAGAGACAPMGPASPTIGMEGMERAGARNVPPVKGFADGQEILFIHTEASDGQVAAMLTEMMGSPVLVVPALAQVPASALADVFVFKNGVKGEGPFGFQPDVFDRTPAQEGYSPLRAVNLVTWKDAARARILRSVGQVRDAERAGELTMERSGAVVNMPMLRWPGGQR